MEAIKEITSQFPSKTPREVLESYNHIQLTDDEMDEAILWAKMRKEKIIEKQKIEKAAEENRKRLTGMMWSFEQTKDFMLWRASQIFSPKKFILDENNQSIFDLLCYYFCGDRMFLSLANEMGINEPSLEKGICMAGNFGVGKSWLMQLFRKNQRQVYYFRSAKKMANEFEMLGEGSMEQYYSLFTNPKDDPAVFYQPVAGLCIDDLGTEDIKNNFGNRKNVIGDLIETRYQKGFVGIYLHATTNLSGDQIEQFYGGRVRSRMREIFNFIELPGADRRK